MKSEELGARPSEGVIILARTLSIDLSIFLPVNLGGGQPPTRPSQGEIRPIFARFERRTIENRLKFVSDFSARAFRAPACSI